MSVIVGIDLGTSTTEAAVWRDGKPVMLRNPEGEIVTPSVVGLDENGDWLIGEEARERLLLDPKRTVAEVKRLIGTGKKVTLDKKQYTPVQLSARLLTYVRNYVSEALEEPVTRAVISVPAYFDERQRQQVLQAGQQAGFQVERILNEPTAAALSYGLGHMDEESHVLVYDLGGGTFDVTLLEMFEGVLEVKASGGDNQLGGKDFDEALMRELNRRFQEKNGVSLRQNPFAMAHLKAEAEYLKRQLSVEEEASAIIPAVTVDANGKPLALDERVSRAEFEALTANLLQRTHAPIDRVLEDSGLKAKDIDRVILVGGSTRMPMVARDIHAYLGLEVSESVNPDFAVAEGAAIEAAILAGEIDPEEGLVMTDVNPYSLGVRAVSDEDDWIMSIIIPRNVTIPVTRHERFYTAAPYQSQVKIEVYQGENKDVRKNNPLGDFLLSGIKPQYDSQPVEVYFTYNINGMLDVRALSVKNRKEANLTINLHADAEEAAEEPTPLDITKWQQSPLAKPYRPIIRTAERLLRLNDLPGEQASKLFAALNALKGALMAEAADEAASCEKALLKLIQEVRA